MSLVTSFGNSVYAYIPSTRSQALWRTGAGFNSLFFFSESTTQTHFLSFEWGPGRGQLCSGLRLQYKWLLTWAFYDPTIEALIKSHSPRT